MLTSRTPPTPAGITYLTCPPAVPSARPFAPAAFLEIADDRISVRSDPVGLKHLFVFEGEGFCALSTSAVVLAGMVQATLNDSALAHLALLGFVVSAESLFTGIQKLAGGQVATLGDGSLRIASTPSDPMACADGGEAALRRSVDDLLATSPDAVVELSGGLDSRLVLAALRPSSRRRRVAFTIRTQTGDDERIASTIAALEGLDHQLLSASPARASAGDEIRRRVERAAMLRDYCADALASAALDAVEEQAPCGPRFTGVNGEYARGFYYPGTLPGERTSRRSVGRVVRWRMLTNHRVDGSLFAPGWEDEQVGAYIGDLTDLLQGYSQNLRLALDEFYLHHRVVRWAGPAYSHTATHRTILAPFLHPAFLSWVRATAPRERAGSRAMARVLTNLAPNLAALPLADGRVPASMAARGPVHRLRGLGTGAEKAAGKVVQRLRGARRPPQGADAMLQPLLEDWSAATPFDPLRRVGFIDQRQLDRWEEDPRGIDPSTVSFIVNLVGIVTFLDRVDTAASGDSCGGPVADDTFDGEP